jgi:hypothetical protein
MYLKLSRLLEVHKKFSTPQSLTTNLGDGYLIRHNKVYKNIRMRTLSSGFVLSDDSNPFYQALPLSQLENLLKAKKIPFTDNVSVLKIIENQMPSQFEWNDITDNLKSNQILHESCHAVAREVFRHSIGQSTHRESAFLLSRPLQMLIEESFANACELLAICDVHESAHKIFYEINSYTSLFEERTHLLNAKKQFGESAVLKFLILSYLCANFLHESLDESKLSRLIRLAFANASTQFALNTFSLEATDLKMLRALSKICFRLDKRFRTVTTSFYLRLSGVSKDFRDVLTLDFLKIFETDLLAKKYLDSLADSALKSHLN